MATTVERWKPVAGAPAYQVSKLGNVRSHWKEGEPVPVKRSPNRSGHLFVEVRTADGKRKYASVARMVLDTWGKRKPKPGEVAIYKDGDPGHCHLANLTWGTREKAAKLRKKARGVARAA